MNAEKQSAAFGNTAAEVKDRVSSDYLNALLREARKKFRLPAVAVTLMDSTEIYRHEVQGVRVSDQQDRATLDDYFHIGSCSKSVLTLIAARIIAQQKIDWQTRFFQVFPELAEDADEGYCHITLEDLFLCEAGIKAYTDAETEPLPEYDDTVRDPRQAFIKELVTHAPATDRQNGRFKHLYSNASYTMASAMLERVAGLNYEDLVREHLTGALGLAFYIGWPNNIGNNQPWGHLISKNKVQALAPDHEYKMPYLITPAGDLSMTARDYAKYTQLHLRGLRGEENFISTEAFRYLHFGHDGFSLGIANGRFSDKRFSGFDGSAGTFFCRSIIVPQDDLALTVMMNAGNGTASMKAVDWLTMKIIKKYYNWWWIFWL